MTVRELGTGPAPHIIRVITDTTDGTVVGDVPLEVGVRCDVNGEWKLTEWDSP